MVIIRIYGDRDNFPSIIIVTIFLPYYLHVEVPYSTMYVGKNWSRNYRHSLTANAYQQLLLFIVAVKLRLMVLWYTPYLRDSILFAANHKPFLPAMKPEESQFLFAARLDVFDPVLGQPTDTDLTWICEEITTILLPLLYDVEKGIHNLMGLIMDEDYYKVRYHSKFPNDHQACLLQQGHS